MQQQEQTAPLAVTVPMAATLVGVGVEKMRELVGSGEIPSVQVSPGRRIVPVRELEAWLDRRMEASR